MCCWLAINAMAQDPIFAQYFTNRLYLNPALAGFEGGTTVNMNYRNQWNRIGGPNSKFTTQSVAIDMEAPCLQSAFGLVYFDNVEGEGYLRWQSAGMVYAWRMRPEKNAYEQKLDFSVGMKGTYNWRSLNWDNLVFSDQLDAIYGNIGPSQINLQNDLFDRGQFFDFDLGMDFNYKISDERRIQLGVVANHLVQINNSVFSQEDTLPMRFTLHASYIHSVNFGGRRNYHLVPMIKLDMQKASIPNFGAGFLYRSIDYGVAFSVQGLPGIWGGLWLHTRNFLPDNRNTNSLSAALGWEFGNDPKAISPQSYRVGMSYTYDFTGVRSDGGGIFEVSLVMNFADVHLFKCDSRRRGSLPCPKF